MKEPKMSDTEKLSEAMKELAAAIRGITDKLPNLNGGFGGYTVFHQHSGFQPLGHPSLWGQAGGRGYP